LRDETVVRRIVNGGVEDAIELDQAACFIEFVLHARSERDLDDAVEFLREFVAGSYVVPGMDHRSSADSAARLPVTRVILYKNGVGYFEHAGHVRGSQDVNVDFTTAQLNDVLKSLTVLDLGKGRITGVSYNSNAPLAKRLGSLHLPVGENPTTAQFLDALRGARLEVKSGSESASGRLLSIDEREIPIKGDQKITIDQISIVSDAGEVRVFDLTPSTSVRVAEKEVNEEVGKYLGLVASTRDQDLRRMTISTAGEGERNLLVSYISEVPVWKSTYRIVIPNEGKPLLQGWAIVDNTVGEDWKNVELSLVAGAPQSFVQELSQPYYTRRPVVALPENAMITPQTHEATMEKRRSTNGNHFRWRSRRRSGRRSRRNDWRAHQRQV
jgi:hypothetical protein